MDELKQIAELHSKWWFEHQSAKTCILGSDGVGHDMVHPVDQLQGACRNAWTMITAVRGYELNKKEKLIKIRGIKRKIEDLSRITKQGNSIIPDLLDEKELLEVELERQNMELYALELTIKDRNIAKNAFLNHVKELHEQVSSKYSNYEEALNDIWISRVAYQAMVKNHPIGQELKIALMTEDQKQEALDLMAFPKEFPAPNANGIINVLNERLMGAKDGKKVLCDVRER